MTRKKEIRVGCCGFALSHSNYYLTFPVIEIEQTFYKLPKPETARKWRLEAPDDFEFSLKAFQAITHRGDSPTYRRSRLSEADRSACGDFADNRVVRESWKKTLAIARELRANFVIFQSPARFKPTEENIRNIRRFMNWAQRDGIIFGWESRGKWPPCLIRSLCEELSLIDVVDPFLRRSEFGHLNYFRLHGIGSYSYRFKKPDLERLLSFCNRPLNYCMFNNRTMAEDARRFMRMI